MTLQWWTEVKTNKNDINKEITKCINDHSIKNAYEDKIQFESEQDVNIRVDGFFNELSGEYNTSAGDNSLSTVFKSDLNMNERKVKLNVNEFNSLSVDDCNAINCNSMNKTRVETIVNLNNMQVEKDEHLTPCNIHTLMLKGSDSNKKYEAEKDENLLSNILKKMLKRKKRILLS